MGMMPRRKGTVKEGPVEGVQACQAGERLETA